MTNETSEPTIDCIAYENGKCGISLDTCPFEHLFARTMCEHAVFSENPKQV